MLFSDFADRLDELASASIVEGDRLSIDLIQEIPASQLAQAVVMLSGTHPANRRLSSSVMKALSAVSGLSLTKIRAQVRLDASIAEATSSTMSKRTQGELSAVQLTLGEVCRELRDLTLADTGPKKATLRLGRLLAGTSPLGSRLIVSILMGQSGARSREPSIVNGLSRRLGVAPAKIRELVRSHGWESAVTELVGSPGSP